MSEIASCLFFLQHFFIKEAASKKDNSLFWIRKAEIYSQLYNKADKESLGKANSQKENYTSLNS